MQCPVCKKEMVEVNIDGVVIDICKDSCKGMWFDWHELTKLDEKHENVCEVLEEALNHPRTNREDRGKIHCPKCEIPMFIHKHKSSKEVDVDECYNCAGFFLDSGELKAIRDNFMTKEEAEEYVSELLSNVPEYHEAHADLQKQKLRTDAVHSYTKFLRVSYYMGK